MLRLRVLSYNIHKGFAALGRDFMLAEIKRAIRAANADVLFLQEVLGAHDKHGLKSGSVELSQFEYLADEVWPHFAYGRNAVYSAGHHGNAILSKLPILGVENEDISLHRWERRGLLHARIHHPAQGFECNLICLHLNLLARHRRKQLDLLLARVQKYFPKGPAIIAGDFNDWQGALTEPLANAGFSEAHAEIHGGHAPTFPSFFPVLGLDRIYVRGLTPISAQALEGDEWRGLSDHVPLAVELEWHPTTPS